MTLLDEIVHEQKSKPNLKKRELKRIMKEKDIVIAYM
jgi:hypothetical protein